MGNVFLPNLNLREIRGISKREGQLLRTSSLKILIRDIVVKAPPVAAGVLSKAFEERKGAKARAATKSRKVAPSPASRKRHTESSKKIQRPDRKTFIDLVDDDGQDEDDLQSISAPKVVSPKAQSLSKWKDQAGFLEQQPFYKCPRVKP